MRALPLLETRRRELETCVYCPKLCRSACPVSNAEPRETLTPWGKMSNASFSAHGDVPLNESFASTAWACTGCMACREACDHKNPVAPTLFDARSAFADAGVAPRAATAVRERWAAVRVETQAAAHALATGTTGRRLLVGCTYARKLPAVAADAIAVARAIHGDVVVEEDCCGLPLFLAGDRDRFRDHVSAFAERARGGLTVVDPGCAMALRVHAPAVGAPAIDVTLLVEEIAAWGRNGRVGDLAGPVRWHDPCQLGRGLGVYEAPRQVLTRALGHAPAEFAHARGGATCSGAGGLLPKTMPDTARTIAAQRRAEHDESGGGTIVTGCASSAIAFAKAGAKVLDVVTVARRGLPAR
jgi:Fe-S oxidoreductase